mmetsp:Transcript_4912/g.21029  ORF Transcript_4912/g.21029 Transcript_4912/m.21029 type:complete len:427 (-) Transcript_4912:2766-4046(-)
MGPSVGWRANSSMADAKAGTLLASGHLSTMSTSTRMADRMTSEPPPSALFFVLPSALANAARVAPTTSGRDARMWRPNTGSTAALASSWCASSITSSASRSPSHRRATKTSAGRRSLKWSNMASRQEKAALRRGRPPSTFCLKGPMSTTRWRSGRTWVSANTTAWMPAVASEPVGAGDLPSAVSAGGCTRSMSATSAGALLTVVWMAWRPASFTSMLASRAVASTASVVEPSTAALLATAKRNATAAAARRRSEALSPASATTRGRMVSGAAAARRPSTSPAMARTDASSSAASFSTTAMRLSSAAKSWKHLPPRWRGAWRAVTPLSAASSRYLDLGPALPRAACSHAMPLAVEPVMMPPSAAAAAVLTSSVAAAAPALSKRRESWSRASALTPRMSVPSPPSSPSVKRASRRRAGAVPAAVAVSR